MGQLFAMLFAVVFVAVCYILPVVFLVMAVYIYFKPDPEDDDQILKEKVKSQQPYL